MTPQVRSFMALALALSGCATPYVWVHHEHSDSARFERERAQCVYEANLATASAPSTFSLSQNIAQDIATGVRQGELIGLCLRARGYYTTQAVSRNSTPTPVPQIPGGVDEVGAQLFRVEVKRLSIAAGCSDAPEPTWYPESLDVRVYSVECVDGSNLKYRCSEGACVATK